MSDFTVLVMMALGVVAWELGKSFVNWCFDRRQGGGG